MKLFQPWLDSPLAAAIGWTLLHSLWQGAIVAAALGAALLALRSPRVRYVAACASVLAILGGFGVTLLRELPDAFQDPRISPAVAARLMVLDAEADALGPLGLGLAAAVPWLAFIWLIGVSYVCLRNVAGWTLVYRMRRRGVCSVDERWQKELVRLRAQLRVSAPVLLMESCLAAAPIVIGHFRPLILMPIGLLAGLPPGQIEALLLHELAHIRRGDYLVNLLQRLVEALLFYHPAIWWISRVIRAEREHCCDDLVVAIRGDAYEYAVALSAVEQSRWPGREPAVAANGGTLVRRIRRLLYPATPKCIWTPLFAAAVFLSTAALAVAGWQARLPQGSFVAAQQQTERETSPYLRWLNQDVVYIIADEERAAFLRLAADDEREKFIQQFWLRRDPTPQTPQNEIKEEHYRRIEYSNERFRASSRPGWQTDRGRMYIVYGPPDEVETQYRAEPYPYQIWTYRHVEGVGDNVSLTFIDKTGTGDYRLAPVKR